MHASFALKDSHCHRLFIIDFTEDQQLMSVYIYILVVIATVFVSCDTIDQSERRMTDHVICNLRVKLVRGQFEHLVINSPF